MDLCIRKSHKSNKLAIRKNGKKQLEYKFDKEICRHCPNRKECVKRSSIARKLIISVNTPEFYEYSQRTKMAEFKEKYKKRASHEWKNGEMKRFHGLNRARGYGLKSMRTQAKLTAIVVNLKRIVSLLPSFFYSICYLRIRKTPKLIIISLIAKSSF